MHRRIELFVVLTIAAAFAVTARAQQPPAPATTPAAPAKPKPKPKPKPPASPANAEAKRPAKPPSVGGATPKLLGQYADWGAYTADPGGKKVCFIISKPSSEVTVPANRPRNPIYMFISTRPAEKVTNEVSIIVGYPFKPGSEASAQIGSSTFALYTQQDGAWIKNSADETQMVDALKSGDKVIVKGESAKGTQTTDTYNLKGVSQALDRIAAECK